MKTQKLNFGVKAILITLILLLSFACFGLIFTNINVAKAQRNVSSNNYLPSTELEYRALTDPQDAYYSDDVVAIIEDNKLLIYTSATGYFYHEDSFISLRRVKRLGDNFLVVADNAALYTLDINDNFKKSALLTTDGAPVTGNYFDIYGNIIVTSFSNSICVYTISDLSAPKGNTPTVFSGINGDIPFCINADSIFYVDTNAKLCKSDFAGKNIQTLFNLAPKNLIVNENNLYYIVYNNGTAEIYMTSVNGGQTDKLTITSHADYDLGNLQSPLGLCIKNNNLLVVDSGLDAITEFAVNKTAKTLSFTGFAIAKNKTAYNRIGANNIASDLNGSVLTVLDSYKLTVIDNKNGKEFRSFPLGKLNLDGFADGFSPEIMATSNDVIMLANRPEKKICYVDSKSGEVLAHTKVEKGLRISSITYQSGYFYMLVLDDNNFNTQAYIYKFKETDVLGTDKNADPSLLTPICTINNDIFDSKGNNYPKLAVDVYGNLLVSDTINDQIFKYLKADGFETPQIISDVNASDIKKISTDLTGKLFLLYADKLSYYKADGSKVDYPIAKVGYESVKANSFALDIERKNVFFIYQGEEFITVDKTLANACLEDIAVPDEYKTTDTSANIDHLKFYKVNGDANVYSVKVNELNGNKSFEYLGLLNDTNNHSQNKEYILHCQVSCDEQDFLVLFGEQTVIVKAEYTTEITDKITHAGHGAFVATDVSMYYIPYISIDDTFVLTSGAKIRLDTKTQFTAHEQFTFFGKEFYYATVNVGGTDVNGYIPKDFTVKFLSENPQKFNYTVGELNACTVYSDKALTLSPTEIEDGVKIKIFAITDGVAEIEFELNGSTMHRFVSADAIKEQPNNAIRNMLIIFSVAIAVFGTSLYFILRKKKPDDAIKK